MDDANAVEVRDLGIHFPLRHEARATLKGAFVSFLRRRRTENFWALKDLSFQVKKGEVTGIIGENGAGKSTLLKVLAGLLKPDRGEVRMQGRVSTMLDLGLGFHDDLPGRDNIYLNGAVLGLTRKRIDELYDEIVDFSELGKFVDTPLGGYSTGMKLRLGFSVAVCVDPDILLVDEVLAVGDEYFIGKCIARMQQIRDSGKTILCVTHYLRLVEEFADRGIWLSSGRIREVGEPSEVVSHYRETSKQRGSDAPTDGEERVKKHVREIETLEKP